MFSTLNIANDGKRGRPPFQKDHDLIHDKVFGSNGAELGELMLEPDGKGGIILTAVINGRSKTVSFPGKAAPRGRKAAAKPKPVAKVNKPKVTAKRKSTVRKATKATRKPVTRTRTRTRAGRGIQVFA